MIGEGDDRKFAEQCDAEFARRVLRTGAGQVVDRRESHLHLQLLAKHSRLIDEVAPLGPVDVYFLERDQIGSCRADRRRRAGEITIAGPDVVGHHAQRNLGSARRQVRARTGSEEPG